MSKRQASVDVHSLDFEERVYSDALDACESFDDVRKLLRRFPRELVLDAREAADRATAEEWDQFKRGVKSERRGRFAGENWAEKWGAILQPGGMFVVSMVAEDFKVPFSLAYRRLREVRPPYWREVTGRQPGGTSVAGEE